MSSELVRLKNIFKNLISEAREKEASHKNLILTFCVVRRVIRIFTREDVVFFREDRKEAEKILREVLGHEDSIINFLTLTALLDAKNKGRSLDWETEIKIEQFKNNPAYQPIWHKADAVLKSEKAPYN